MVQLTSSQARLLAGAPIGHLSTAGATGAPHVIPICYAFDGHFIYSVLDQKPKRTALTRLRRVRNILANPQVALVVDHYEEDWTRLWYILVTGHAELLLGGDEQQEAIGKLREKYQQYVDMEIALNPVIKIIPDRIVSWGI